MTWWSGDDDSGQVTLWFGDDDSGQMMVVMVMMIVVK